MAMSFLGSVRHGMTETGLKVLLSVVFAENIVPHMLNGKVIVRAIRALTRDDCSRYMSRDTKFPTMWYFDKCRLRQACAASF